MAENSMTKEDSAEQEVAEQNTAEQGVDEQGVDEHSPFVPGSVDWTGENPTLVLREPGAEDYATLVSLFRVRASRHGAGVACVLMETTGGAEALNLCLTDNEPLARDIVDRFVRHFPLYRGRAALDRLSYPKLRTATTESALPSHYVEHLQGEHPAGGDLDITLRWQNLGEPYLLNIPPSMIPFEAHAFFSVFVIAQDADVTVNGRRLRGQIAPREHCGRQITSCFLAFSETWQRVG